MSIILTGDGVSRGICIGQALIVHKDNIDYTPSFITKRHIKRETKKFSNALDKLKTKQRLPEELALKQIGFTIGVIVLFLYFYQNLPSA